MSIEWEHDRIAANLGKTFEAAAKEMQMENAKVYFFGSIYTVRAVNKGTKKEKLIIFRDGWSKPLVLGGQA